ncbi:unnamed protein product [Danaus chrysippus]|uniref:(African queen) hypothetical protein n=1 Tax=Danaus chrysippus TaxID=151541 RepID=A0A8J2R928_9NEOP|nr:unnamed protein product [Danaus chrysippus]
MTRFSEVIGLTYKLPRSTFFPVTCQPVDNLIELRKYSNFTRKPLREMCMLSTTNPTSPLPNTGWRLQW